MHEESVARRVFTDRSPTFAWGCGAFFAMRLGLLAVVERVGARESQRLSGVLGTFRSHRTKTRADRAATATPQTTLNV